MRRAFFFVLLLLAASAVSALAATVESAQAHGKASSNSHRFRHSSSRSTVKHSPVHSRPASRATIHAARYTTPRATIGSRSAPTSALTSASTGGDSHGYFRGYKNGYEAGRAAALRELASKSAETKLSRHPDQVSGAAQVASLRQPSSPAAAPAVPVSHAEYDSVLADRQPPASSAAGVSNPPESTPNLSPGEATERPVSHQPADETVSRPSTGAAAENSEQPESAATARELTHENVESDAPPPDEVAALHLPAAGMPSSLRGSLASLERQNTRLDSEGLERILDEADLSSRIAHGLLVPVPISSDLTVNPNLIEDHRYCRPWTARFLTDLARAHQTAFHRPLEVNSAVRTVEYQTHLMRVNSNAAAAEGDIVSPHLTGAAIDIAKQGMTHEELVWMRRHLLAIQDAGKIDVEEEFRQACFHITVYKTYSSAPSHRSAQPAVRDAANQHQATPSARGNSLPTSIATGTLVPRSR